MLFLFSDEQQKLGEKNGTNVDHRAGYQSGHRC